MTYFVYMLKSLGKETVTYVGYTRDIDKRIKLHNSNKGAKFTKGRKWKIIYSKRYFNKLTALREENKLKKNYKKRKIIKEEYLLKYENNS